MDGFRFDHLSRLVAARFNRRAGLALVAAAGLSAPPSASGKKSKKISICYNGQTRKVKKQGWQRRYPGASKGTCQSSDVCAGCPDACFATVQNSAEAPPPGYGWAM